MEKSKKLWLLGIIVVVLITAAGLTSVAQKAYIIQKEVDCVNGHVVVYDRCNNAVPVYLKDGTLAKCGKYASN